MRDSLIEKLKNLEKSLKESCGIIIPKSNWTEVHDEILNRTTKNVKEEGFQENPECVDWNRAFPEHQTKTGIAAPDYLWKQDPKLYPNPSVNVTFILQYFRQPEHIPLIVDRLYRCTEGRSGAGQLQKLTTTLLVNVDQPNEFKVWHEKWQETDKGSFLVPLLSHNEHDNRGFNKLARAARGEFVFFIQENDVPPEDCTWLTKALSVFHSWPNVAAVGLRNHNVSAIKFDRAGVLGKLQWQGSKEYTPKRLFDPETNVDMHFSSVADVGPLGVRRDKFLELGGFHEGFCKKGNPCSLSDWEFTFRLWLAGHQVVHVDLEESLSFKAGPHSLAPGTREVATALQNVKINLDTLEEIYKDFTGSVTAEVKWLNSHLSERQ